MSSRGASGRTNVGGGKAAGGGGKAAGGGGKGKGGPKRFKKVPLSRVELLTRITNPSLRRMARRAGIKRISSSYYPAARNHIYHSLKDLAYGAMNYAASANRSTIGTKDVIYAAQAHGRTLVGAK